jgi:hypothetical protein
LRDGHEFLLVAFVHEVREALFFGEPAWVLDVLGGAEVDGFGVGVAVVALVVALLADGLQVAAVVVARPYFFIDNVQEIDGLVHIMVGAWSVRVK